MATGFVFSPPFHGHVNPLLSVTEELVRRGEHVVFFSGESFRSDIEAVGAEFRPYTVETSFLPSDETQPVDNFVWLASFMLTLLQSTERLVPLLIREVEDSPPDYIIYDSLAHWGRIVAERAKIPHMCSCAIYYIGVENLFGIIPIKELSLSVVRNFPVLFRDRVAYLVVRRRIKKRWRVRVPYLAGFFVNPGDKTLLYWSRLFQEGAEKLDDSIYFVGHPEPEHPADADVASIIAPDKPYVYVSLGTVFNDRPEFFDLCVAAFAQSSYHVVLSTGIDFTARDADPDNFTVIKWLSVAERMTMIRNASLFVTHGGANSIKEASLHGVPMLLAPQQGDQFYMARRVEQLGAGKVFSWESITPRELFALAQHVISSPDFSANSSRIGGSLREAGGAREAANRVLDLVACERCAKP